jgi:hypothetical protein
MTTSVFKYILQAPLKVHDEVSIYPDRKDRWYWKVREKSEAVVIRRKFMRERNVIGNIFKKPCQPPQFVLQCLHDQI